MGDHRLEFSGPESFRDSVAWHDRALAWLAKFHRLPAGTQRQRIHVLAGVEAERRARHLRRTLTKAGTR